MDYTSAYRNYQLATDRIREAQAEAAAHAVARLVMPHHQLRRRLGLWLIALGERLADQAPQPAHRARAA